MWCPKNVCAQFTFHRFACPVFGYLLLCYCQEGGGGGEEPTISVYLCALCIAHGFGRSFVASPRKIIAKNEFRVHMSSRLYVVNCSYNLPSFVQRYYLLFKQQPVWPPFVCVWRLRFCWTHTHTTVPCWTIFTREDKTFYIGWYHPLVLFDYTTKIIWFLKWIFTFSQYRPTLHLTFRIFM